MMNTNNIAEVITAEIISSKNAVSRPQVLALVGLQYAGKSYLAERIVNKNYAHFWATKIKKEYGLKNPEMLQVATDVIAIVASKRINVVIDFVNHKYEMRQKLQEAASRPDVDYKVVFLDTPKSVRLERREENLRNGETDGRRIITMEQMEEFEHDFEPPLQTEHVVRIVSQQDIEDFIMTL